MSNKERLIHDLTVGSVPKTLIKFALPLFLSGLLQTLYNMVDMVIVGRFVGPEGLAAVSIGGEMLHMLMFIAMGLSNAGQIWISRYVGENRKDKIGKMVGTLFTVLFSASIVLMIVCASFHREMINWLHTPIEAWNMTRDYVLTCIFGLVFIYGYNLVSAILRGMGDSKHPFIFIAIASVINIILDIVFVAILKMGPLGAALGTVISQAVSFIFALTILIKHREQFYFTLNQDAFKVDKESLDNLISLGIPMVIQSAAISFSMLFVNSFINMYGVVVVAVTGIGKKLENMINIMSQSVSSAGGAMVSQCLGRGKEKRVTQTVKTCYEIMVLPVLILSLITIIKPEWLFGLFTDAPEVLKLAVAYIPITLVQYAGSLTRPANFALINGSGNSRLNLAVALLDGVIFRIGFAYFLGVIMNKGILGWWYGSAISGLIPFVIGTIYLVSGKWKDRVTTINSDVKN
ncbi:MAG: MATE family efflux transporter [Solobacterium sp.]|nr:MATE family efflux transporter [Solobacterium sp.]